jgi:RNA polymerase sigma-70 factor (ECF subfamily)
MAKSDLELWQQIRSDDLKAFGELYERHWEMLFEAAYRRLYDKDAAKDIVQEVFIYCWQKKEQIHITDSVAGYLSTAVRFKVLNYLKAEGTRQKYEQQAGGTLPKVTHIPGRDLHNSYHRELEKLPPKMREVFMDSRESGLSISEIAEKRALSPQTVKNQLSGALKKLREGLGNFFME